MKFEKGQILVQTEGDYSDYQIRSFLLCLTPFDGDEIRERYLQEYCQKEGYYYPPRDKQAQTVFREINTSAFIVWLEKNGFVKEIDNGELIEWCIDTDFLAEREEKIDGEQEEIEPEPTLWQKELGIGCLSAPEPPPQVKTMQRKQSFGIILQYKPGCK